MIFMYQGVSVISVGSALIAMYHLIVLILMSSTSHIILI